MADPELDLAEAQLLAELQDEIDDGTREAKLDHEHSRSLHDDYDNPTLAAAPEKRPSFTAAAEASTKPAKEPSTQAKRKPLLHKKLSNNIANAEESKTAKVTESKPSNAADQDARQRPKNGSRTKASSQRPAAQAGPDPDILAAIMASGQTLKKGKVAAGPKKNARATAAKGKGKENKAAGAQRQPARGRADLKKPDEKLQSTGDNAAKIKIEGKADVVGIEIKPSSQDASDAPEDSETAEAEPQDAKKGTQEGAKGKKRGRRAKSATPAQKEAGAKEKAKLPELDEDAEEDEAERQDCDWEKHPAEAILAITRHNKLVVKRKGLDLTEYGLVDAGQVKRQRLEEDTSNPVSLQMLEEYEAWEINFKRCVRENIMNGALELDDLSQNSPLESCYYLGKMLEANYPLSKPQKGTDPCSKFPVIALSMISQRLINVERTRALRAEAKVQELAGQIAALNRRDS